MSFCKNCGHELKADAKFCEKCGARVESAFDDGYRRYGSPVPEQGYFADLRSFNFEGRMNRAKYWKYGLFTFLLALVAYAVVGIVVGFSFSTARSLSAVVGFVLWLLCLPFQVRRLHDLNKSGWWFLLSLIPVVNFFFGIYMGFFKGTDGPNQYGPDPLR